MAISSDVSLFQSFNSLPEHSLLVVVLEKPEPEHGQVEADLLLFHVVVEGDGIGVISRAEQFEVESGVIGALVRVEEL